MFDSTGTAYVGDVTISDNAITSSTSLQPLATRSKDLTNGNILKWDNNNKTLVKATNLKDESYVPTTRTIAGLSLNANIDVADLQTKLNLGSAAYQASTAFLASNGKAVSAATADKLGTDAGSTSQPVYFSNGVPVAITGALSNDITGNASTATSATKLSNSDGDLNVGEPAKPIYFANGIPLQCESILSVDIDGHASTANKATTVLTSNKEKAGSIFIVGVSSSSDEYQSIKTVSDITVTGSNISASDYIITANSFTGSLTGTATNAINASNSEYSTYLGTASENYTYSSLKTALENTGKIDIIKINNSALPIDTSDKSVNITVESSLSLSTNPVQTKVVYDLESKLTNESSLHYYKIYAHTFEGSLNGKADSAVYADRATAIETSTNLTGKVYVPVISSGGAVAYTDKLKYVTSTNTLSVNSISATATIQANYFNSTSDVRLKTDISPISKLIDADKIINDINLYTFKYKSNPNEKCFGVIAQEIKDIDIDDFTFVSENSDGYLSVKESKLVYLLIAGYKEQSAKIKELEERIKSLEE